MNIFKYLSKVKFNKYTILLIVGFLLFSFFIDISFAADGIEAAESNEVDWTKFATWVDFLLKGISAFLALMTYLSSMFLSPEWINGSLFGLTEQFKRIWILVSNVVYFIFAIVLIWIAFMNIIGSSNENYQLKQALPKFIVGILIVPFSWFLVQFVLSISAILTIAAVNLPFDTFSKFETKMESVTVKTNCTMNLKYEDKNNTTDSNGNSGNTKNGYLTCEDGAKLGDIIGNGSSSEKIFGVLSMYTYGIIQLDKIDEISKDEIMKSIGSMVDLATNLFFNILFVIIYSILMIALGLVFMVRGLYIWIYIMLSPVFGLMYFFNKNDGAGDGFFKNINIKEFISLAMVPVYAMLALSFGMLFINTVNVGLTGDVGESPIKISTSEDSSETTFQLSSNSNISLTIIGAAGTKSTEGAGNFLTKGTNGALGVIGGLIMKIFGIVVLWGAMMAAMRHSEITKTVVEPLHAFGGQVGGLMTKLPQYAPVFGGQSMQSMSQIAGKYKQTVEQTSIDSANRFADKAPFLKGANHEVTSALKKIENRIENETTYNDSSFKRDYEDWIKAAGGDSTKMLSSSFLETAKKMGNKMGIDTKNFNNSNEQKIIDSIIKPFEEKLDGTRAGGLTSKITGSGGTMTKDELKELVKNIYTGTVTPSSNGGNDGKIISNFDNDDKPYVEINNAKIMLNKDRNELLGSSIKTFARKIDGMNYEETKQNFTDQGLDKFDDLFKQAIDELGNDAIKKVDDNIEVDLSKAK